MKYITLHYMCFAWNIFYCMFLQLCIYIKCILPCFYLVFTSFYILFFHYMWNDIKFHYMWLYFITRWIWFHYMQNSAVQLHYMLNSAVHFFLYNFLYIFFVQKCTKKLYLWWLSSLTLCAPEAERKGCGRNPWNG